MVRASCSAFAAAILSLQHPIPIIASPVHDNVTTNVARLSQFAGASNAARSSSAIGGFILQGLDNEAFESSSKAPTTARPTRNVSSSTTHPSPYEFTSLSEGEWMVVTSKTLRPTGAISWASSMPEVEKCWSDIVTWRDSSIKWWNSHIASSRFSGYERTTQTTILGITETVSEWTVYPTSASTYKLCDGSPRVDIRPETRTTTWNVTKSRTQVLPAAVAFTQTQPCMPDPRTCRLWYYASNINVTNEDELLTQCGFPSALYEDCLVGGGPVQLIYWPEETNHNGLCPNNASMLLQHVASRRTSSTLSLPDTITALGTTFTSGSVYLSFKTLYASYDGFYDRVGPTFKDTIIAVPSDAMSTHCGGFTEAHGPATPLNYADLNWPVAASAYKCQARCDQATIPHASRSSISECNTIWSDVNPNIAIPTMVKDLVPEWSNCKMEGFRIPNFWYDPPVALTQQATIALPTTHHTEPTKEPPAPSATRTSTIPAETGALHVSDASQVPSIVESLPTSSTHAEAPKPTAADPIQSQGQDEKSQPAPEPSKVQGQDPQLGISTVRSVATTKLAPSTVAAISTPSEEQIDGPVETTESDSSTIRFSYQPLSSSLDALSVLQSALSDLTSTVKSSTFHSKPPVSGNDPSLPSAGAAVPPLPYTESDGSSRQTKTDAFSTGITKADEIDITLPSASYTTTEAPLSPDLSSPDKTEVAPPGSATTTLTFADPTNESLPPVVVAPRPEVWTLAATGLTLTASFPTATNVMIVGGHTLFPGDPVISHNGYLVSAGTSGPVAISSGSTVSFIRVKGNDDDQTTQLEVEDQTVTAELISSSPGVISVGGTTLVSGGDVATLDNGQAFTFGSTGIGVMRSNETITLSSQNVEVSASATDPSLATDDMASSGTGRSQPAEGGAPRVILCSASFMVFALWTLLVTL